MIAVAWCEFGSPALTDMPSMGRMGIELAKYLRAWVKFSIGVTTPPAWEITLGGAIIAKVYCLCVLRLSQALTVISGPMPQGSPSVKRRGLLGTS